MHSANGSMQGKHTKGSEYQWIFFVVPGNGPALLGMSDCKRSQVLSINYHSVSNGQKKNKERSKQKRPKQKFLD